MRRQSSFLLLSWLLCLDNLRVVHSQANHQHRRQQQQQHQQRQAQQQRPRYDDHTKHDDANTNSKQEFYTYLQHQNLTSSILRIHKPKHVVEAIYNSILYSGGLFLSGAVTMVGIPAASLYRTVTQKRIGPLIGGTLLGGLLGCGAWFMGGVYLVFQLVMGLLATPSAIWAWMEGRVEYNEQNRMWEFYNLTQHEETLASSPYSANNKVVRDVGFYSLLGVDTTASSKEIKHAYYQLAKEYHPDKNPNFQDHFMKIHTAYETLYDDGSRKIYDEWGSSSNNNAGSTDAIHMFDPGIFVDVFFGVSPELESYIGDLALKSFMKLINKIVHAQQQDASSDDDAQKKQEMVNDLLSALRVNHSRDVRQVDIALYLTDFTKDYVASDTTENEFRTKCQTEARNLLQSTPFPKQMLTPIGSTLYWEARHASVTNPFSVPMSVVARARGSLKGMQKWMEYGTDMYRFYGSVQQSYAEAMEQSESSRRSATKNRRRNRQQQQEEDERRIKEIQLTTFKTLLPELLDFFWKFNAHDITDTLKGAVWKVLNSNTCWNKRRQSKALKILGQAIVNAAKTAVVSEGSNNEVCGDSLSTVDESQRSTKKSASSGTTCGTNGFIDIEARIEMALKMATMGGGGT